MRCKRPPTHETIQMPIIEYPNQSVTCICSYHPDDTMEEPPWLTVYVNHADILTQVTDALSNSCVVLDEDTERVKHTSLHEKSSYIQREEAEYLRTHDQAYPHKHYLFLNGKGFDDAVTDLAEFTVS